MKSLVFLIMSAVLTYLCVHYIKENRINYALMCVAGTTTTSFCAGMFIDDDDKAKKNRSRNRKRRLVGGKFV